MNNAVDEILVDYLLDNEAAISYFGYTYFFSRSDVLAAVPIFNDGTSSYVSPDADTIASGEYAPFSRPIYMNLLTREEALDDTASFIKFGLSSFGENLVEQTGYVPIPSSLSQSQVERVDGFLLDGKLDNDSDGLSTGAIVGIVIAAVVVLLLGVYLACRSKGGEKRSTIDKDYGNGNGTNEPTQRMEGDVA